jgi:hypothetical protein
MGCCLSKGRPRTSESSPPEGTSGNSPSPRTIRRALSDPAISFPLILYNGTGQLGAGGAASGRAADPGQFQSAGPWQDRAVGSAGQSGLSVPISRWRGFRCRSSGGEAFGAGLPVPMFQAGRHGRAFPGTSITMDPPSGHSGRRHSFLLLAPRAAPTALAPPFAHQGRTPGRQPPRWRRV